MKRILNAAFVSALLILSSCAHHQCGMHKSSCKECCKEGNKDQCPMKSESKDTGSAATPEKK